MASREALAAKIHVRDDQPVQGSCAGERCADLRLICSWDESVDPQKAMDFCQQQFDIRAGSLNICHAGAAVMAHAFQDGVTVPAIFAKEGSNA